MMSFQFLDANTQYIKDENLKKSEVDELLQWINEQPHLPAMNDEEFQAILFLQSCYYKIGAAKTAVDTFFAIKSLESGLFGKRNPTEPEIATAFDTGLVTPLPKKTPDGSTIFFVKLIDTKSENYNFVSQLKYLDMSLMLHLHVEEGISQGHVIVFDMKGTSFGHVAKLVAAGPSVVKKFSFYLQEAIPLRLKGLHFFNVVPFMDKVLSIVRPFMNLGILDMLHLHADVEDLVRIIPVDCLPRDYGGSVESCSVLHEKNKERMLNNKSFFEWEARRKIDANKRPDKSQKVNEIFGIDGSFKKLQID